MKIEIFAIRDRALGAFMRPWCAQALGQAIRMFQDEVNNNQGDLHKHPDDYDLYHIGTFHDDTGDIVQVDTKAKLIATATNLINK